MRGTVSEEHKLVVASDGGEEEERNVSSDEVAPGTVHSIGSTTTSAGLAAALAAAAVGAENGFSSPPLAVTAAYLGDIEDGYTIDCPSHSSRHDLKSISTITWSIDADREAAAAVSFAASLSQQQRQHLPAILREEKHEDFTDREAVAALSRLSTEQLRGLLSTSLSQQQRQLLLKILLEEKHEDDTDREAVAALSRLSTEQLRGLLATGEREEVGENTSLQFHVLPGVEEEKGDSESSSEAEDAGGNADAYPSESEGSDNRLSGIDELKACEDQIIKKISCEEDQEEEGEGQLATQDTSTEKDNWMTNQAVSVAVQESLRVPGADWVPSPPSQGNDASATNAEPEEGPSEINHSSVESVSGEEVGPERPWNAEVVSSPPEMEEYPVAQLVPHPPEAVPLMVLRDFEATDAETGPPNEDSRNSLSSQLSNQQARADRAERRSKIVTRILCLTCFLMVLAAIIMLALFMTADGPSSPTNPPKTGSPRETNPSRFSSFTDDFKSASLKGSTEDRITGDPDSSQHKASEWVRADPHRHEYSEKRLIQRFMCASFWFSTNGANWTNNENWMSYDVSECEWYTAHPNKTICDENNVLQTINLTSNNLQGLIPDETLYLLKATVVDVSHNELSGEIPPMFRQVASIVKHLDYSYNKLTGDFHIETNLEGMALEYINVRSNQLTAELPILHMPHLVHMDMRDNQFQGKIPTLLSRIGKLEVVLLGNNQLTGSIPAEVAQLKRLTDVDLSGNAKMHGTLPPELGSLHSLKWVNLTGTPITGAIPEVLCDRERKGELLMSLDCGGDTDLHCCASS